MEWLNFRHLYAFWMVCRHAGFKNAAEAMFIAQSAVSDHVSQLEGYFDARLLERNNRKIQLTEKGAALLQFADRIFSESRNINQLFREHEGKSTPLSLRIGIAGGVSRNFLFRRLTQILTDMDGLQVEIINGGLLELTQMLRSYELDVMVATEVLARKDLVQIEQHLVGHSELCLAGKPALMNPIIQGKVPRKPIDIYSFGHPSEPDLVEKVLNKKMKLNATERLVSDDVSLLRFFANSGAGLAIMPRTGLREDIDKGVVQTMPLPRLPEVNFYASFLKQGVYHQTLKQLFVDE